MKDAKGHGSNGRGGSTFDRLNEQRKAQGYAPMSEKSRGLHDFLDYMSGDGPQPAAMAAVLGGGHPKSDPAPVHPGAAGRGDSFFGRMNDKQLAAHNAEANAFQKSRITKGPHYLDPKDPRGRRK